MDKKAKKILFDIYWSPKGWILEKNRKIDPIDFEYAKSKGIMFDSFSISKSELIDKLKEITNRISIQEVSNAFLCSLTTRQLELRSAIASYANALRIVNGEKIKRWDLQENYMNEDLNVLNFERLKWGGVRHSQALYNYLDLLLFNETNIAAPKKEDAEIFRGILREIEASAKGEYPSKLRDRLKNIFKSTKDERSNMLEILGCSQILKPGSYDRPTTGRNDWNFVEYWRGEDKYNSEAVFFYFGHLF
jgi:hypothetical protein